MTNTKPEVKVGDFLFGVTVKPSTSAVHDNPTNEERDRRKQEDEREAKHGLGAPAPGHEPPAELTPSEAEVGAKLDDSLEDERERLDPGQAIPIFVVDPVSGKQFEDP